MPTRAQIGADQLSAVVRASPAALGCGIINAAIITSSFLSASVPYVPLFAWFLLTVLISVYVYRRSKSGTVREASSLSRRAMKRAVVTALVLALPWAVAAPLYLGRVPHASELLLITVLAGMASGGSVVLAPVYPAAIAYMLSVLTPFALTCFALMTPGYAFLGLVSVSFGSFLMAVIATTARLSVERAEALRELTRTTRLLKERDAVISAQNERFETALNNMTQGLCFFDGEQRLIVCNRRYIELYGLDPARVQPGVTLADIVDMRIVAGTAPSLSKDEYLSWRSSVGRADGPSETVHHIGNGRAYSIRYRPMADGAWVATTDDITEPHRLRSELEENHRLLGERTALLQAVIDNFPGGIGYYDRDLRVAVCNEQAKAILDLPEHLFENGPPRLEDIMRFNALRGEYGPGNVEEQVASKLALVTKPYRFERTRPDGTVLDVRGAPVDNGGFITTYMDITERYRAEEKIAHMATHDALTGLANRVLFRDQLDRTVAAVRHGERGIALLMLDLNKFKQVNDTLGHPVGDQLLVTVAQRLAGCVRENDAVARLGGDEFAIVLHVTKPFTEAEGLAKRILLSISAPYQFGEHCLNIGTSIGIAVAHSADVDAELMVKHADLALYRAKADGDNRYRFFESGMAFSKRLVA